LTVGNNEGDSELECECLLAATGRLANVENLGQEEACGKVLSWMTSLSVGDHDILGVSREFLDSLT
jgi:hypothetical protein